jgi:hypothetical protein
VRSEAPDRSDSQADSAGSIPVTRSLEYATQCGGVGDTPALALELAGGFEFVPPVDGELDANGVPDDHAGQPVQDILV